MITSASAAGDSITWDLRAQGISVGCTVYTPCMDTPPFSCYTDICGAFEMGDPHIHVTRAGTTLSASETDLMDHPFTLDGSIDGTSVTFTIQGEGINCGLGPTSTTTYTGTLKGNVIKGDFSGSASWPGAGGATETGTWSGTFEVTTDQGAVGYSTTVTSGQNTVIQSSDGAFGTILRGSSKTISHSVVLNNLGDTPARVDARFADSVGGFFGLVSGPNVLFASNFAMGPTGDSLVALMDDGTDVQVATAAVGTTDLDARLSVPADQPPGAYSGNVILTFSNA
jgi:hypothetical protein